jgi:hypothetical protein
LNQNDRLIIKRDLLDVHHMRAAVIHECNMDEKTVAEAEFFSRTGVMFHILSSAMSQGHVCIVDKSIVRERQEEEPVLWNFADFWHNLLDVAQDLLASVHLLGDAHSSPYHFLLSFFACSRVHNRKRPLMCGVKGPQHLPHSSA